jgi:hypothetical protein
MVGYNGYKVLRGFWLHGVRYDEGDPVPLTPQEAVHLLRAKKVAPDAESAEPGEKSRRAAKKTKDETKEEGGRE